VVLPRWFAGLLFCEGISSALKLRVEKHVLEHKYLLNTSVVDREITIDEAYASWLEYVFTPHCVAASRICPQQEHVFEYALDLSDRTKVLKALFLKEELEATASLSAEFVLWASRSHKLLPGLRFRWYIFTHAKRSRWRLATSHLGNMLARSRALDNHQSTNTNLVEDNL